MRTSLNFALLAIAGAASLPPASAQITLDGTVGRSGALAGPAYSILATDGRQVGGNLFHSFGRFNVNTGESATFSGPASVSNVIGRVTEGLRSSIDGALRSTISGANLFLINPAGVVFGPNASLDVSGSFYASSAHYLALGTNGRYDAITPSATVLSSAPPSAFGFVAANPAASVELDRTRLNASPGTSLTFVGGNVTLAGARLFTSAGNVNIASIASPGEVALINSETELQPGTRGGSIAITDSFLRALSAVGAPAGKIVIRGGTLRLVDSTVASINLAAAPASPVTIQANDFSMDRAVILTTTGGSGSSAGIDVQANRVGLAGGSQVSANTAATGASGNISIAAAESFTMSGMDANGNPTRLESLSGGSGRAGDVVVAAPLLTSDGGVIRSNTVDKGAAGNITIQANRMTLTNGGQLDASSFGDGAAGAITVDVSAALEISNPAANGRAGGVFSNSSGSGPGGAIVVRGPVVTLTNAVMNADAKGSASPGSIEITADRVVLSRGGQISSSSSAPAPGSVVRITALESVDISGTNDSGFESAIFGETSGSGSGSEIIVRTPLLTMNGGGISTRTTDRGSAGNITIQEADRVVLTGGSQINLGSTVSGAAGRLLVTAAESINVSGRNARGKPSGFFSRTEGSGAGGNIMLTAPVVTLDDGIVRAGTSGGGVGGSIAIAADRVTLANGGQLDSTASGTGAGGTVNVTALQSIAVVGANEIQPSTILAASQGSGRGGEITLNAPQIAIDGAAVSSGTIGSGAAGSIVLRGNTLSLANGARVLANSQGAGPGGPIAVTASESLTLTGGSSISASSSGSGNAGSIDINAGDALRLTDSAIRTRAERADGGNIHIQAVTLVHLKRSQITTSVGTGFGNGGNINIDPRFVILDSSQIIANAFGGSGGNINIVTDALLPSGDSVISASSQLGIPGTITISAPESDLTGGLTPLPGGLFDPSLLLRESCSARAGRAGNTFVGVGHGGLPDRPGSFAYSSYAQLPLGAAAGRAPIFSLAGTLGSSCFQ